MKIALVNTLYSPYQIGGAERSVQLLAEALSQRGHEVSVISLGEAHLDRRSCISGVTVHRLLRDDSRWWPYSYAPGSRAARMAWHISDSHNARISARVGALLDEVRPDILHTHLLVGLSVGVWREATRRRIPIVHTLRDYYLMCPPGAMYRASNCGGICTRCLPFAAYRRRASRAVLAVTGVSRFILERHTRAGFFARSVTARVIFNPLPLAPRIAARSRGEGLVFGFIGRIGVEKGVRWLLESFCASALPGARLLVAGKGAPAFEASLKAQFSSPSVTFLGQVDPALFYEQVDVVVVPSLWNEPFGRTAIEPLAYGIPVIASNRGGLPEIVQDGVTGAIVDPDDAASLGRTMRRFFEQPELIARLGANGRQHASQFSQDSIAEAYASLYAELACRSESQPSLRAPRVPVMRAR